MYVQNSSASLYSAPEEKLLSKSIRETQADNPVKSSLENFSEKAVMTFESMSIGLSPEKREELTKTLNTIGKAAAFASMNGFESQSERMIVTQYFENLGGVISDDAIKKMIFSKLNNPGMENAGFLKEFAAALDEPLKHIDISV